MTVFFIRRNVKRRKRSDKKYSAESERAKCLLDLKCGEIAKIARVTADGGALSRLTALGVVAGAQVEILAYSLFGSSVLVSCASVRVSIRRGLAEKIQIEN